jgi:hypothetical protein
VSSWSRDCPPRLPEEDWTASARASESRDEISLRPPWATWASV